MMRSMLLWVLALACASTMRGAEEGAWKVGLASRKVTPQTPVFLAGYASRNKPFETVVSDLYVKALVLEDAMGTKAALVTSDVIGFRAQFAEPICEQIEGKTGIPRTHVILNASHTHTGPTLTLDENERENMSAEDLAPHGGLHA